MPGFVRFSDILIVSKKFGGFDVEIERILKDMDSLVAGHGKTRQEASEGEAYYLNNNDIRRQTGFADLIAGVAREVSPLRNADFRISHNWHNLLVNQKAAYLFTYPPFFDAKSAKANDALRGALGQRFSKVLKDLVIDASNAGVGWLHCWLDREKNFCYANLPGAEVIPIYGDDLYRRLEGVIRYYQRAKEDGGIEDYFEVWNGEEAAFYRRQNRAYHLERRFAHGMQDLPFIAFYNNSSHCGDLHLYKDLIDQYDRVVSGYANDLADIQEVIFVLRNYGGEDLNTFLSELKRYKAIKVEGDSLSSGGVETMQIEIPMEARIKFLELLRRQIFISGQGVDPDPANFGNVSGVALKYLYSLLEIKAGLLETEFRAGFDRLFPLIFHHAGIDPVTGVEQVYYRNAIANDLEKSTIAKESQGILSQRTILLNHPWVTNVEEEGKNLRGEAAETAAKESTE